VGVAAGVAVGTGVGAGVCPPPSPTKNVRELSGTLMPPLILCQEADLDDVPDEDI